MPDTILSDVSGKVFGPIDTPGTVPGTVTRIELGKQGGTAAILSVGITAGASAQADAIKDDTSFRSAGAETGDTEIGAEIGAAGVGTEVETTTVDTMGPGDLAEVSERPLLQTVRSATPTPTAPPAGTGTPEAAEGPRETNNSTLRGQQWYICKSVSKMKTQLMVHH